MKTVDAIYGLFPGPSQAERGLRALLDAGVAQEKIVVMSDEPFEEYEFSKAPSTKRMYRIAALGGIIGGSLGFLLARFMQTAYPFPLITGGMPLVSPYPTGIVTYELTMFSVIITTLVTLLITSGLPKWNMPIYDAEVSNGMVLIGVVNPSENSRADLESRLQRAGAASVKGTGRFARA